MTTPQTIAVLGLGRIGAAVATRLAACGWNVVGWTRSGRRIAGIRAADDPARVVAEANVVLLALFDGPACRQILESVSDSLRPDTIVVNISTIGPVESADLARRLGRIYVHAPVLGSVPAAVAGRLHLLVSASQEALDQVEPILQALGAVERVGDAATAAALKLVANSSLAGAILALRESLLQADALGLPREQTLDVLELGQLGRLVASKRPWLSGRSDVTVSADFTIGALTKDLTLLATASETPLRSAADLSANSAGPEADIAVAATAAMHTDAILEPLRAYLRGHATGDPAHFRDAFLPTAHVEGIRDGAFVSWSLDEYCALFPGRPAPDEPTRSRRINTIDIRGSVATASMTLQHGPDTFTDVFLLVMADGTWRIANKAYHRHPSSEMRAMAPPNSRTTSAYSTTRH